MSVWGKARQVLGSGTGSAQPASPRELFAAEVEAAIRAAPSIVSVRRNPDAFGFLVTREGRKEQMLFLDNAFAETRDMAPEQRSQRIARLVRSMYTPDTSTMSWQEARPRLAPLLRTTSLFVGGPGIGDDLAKHPLRRPFVPFLIECVGLDSDDAISYVSPHSVAEWNVQSADVFAASIENALAYFQGDVGPYDRDAPYPIWHVSRDDSYESSRLLVPGWLASFAGRVKGRPVAIVPERSTCIVGGDSDERCLRRLIETAKAEYEASPRRISPALYGLDGEGKVCPLVLPKGHALAADTAVGHILMAIGEYGPQQQQLEKLLGKEVFIGRYTGLKGPDGSVFAYTKWSKGVPALLPKADQVAFEVAPQDETGEMFRVPWQAVLEIAGEHLVQEPDLDPPRWRTTGWPDDSTLSKLRAVAVR
jgi:hypothetical protein